MIKWLDNKIKNAIDLAIKNLNKEFADICSEANENWEIYVDEYIKKSTGETNISLIELSNQITSCSDGLSDSNKNNKESNESLSEQLVLVNRDIHSLREEKSRDVNAIKGLIETLVNKVGELGGVVYKHNELNNHALKALEIKIDLLEKSLNDKINTIANDMVDFDDFRNKMDGGIISLTKKKLLETIDAKVDTFEGNINIKMSGLMIYINEKLSGHSDNPSQDINVLKRLARLEDVHDAIEHRRTSEEIMDKREKILDDQEGKTDDIVKVLDWVLGDNNVNI